jgi:hypothetical protein
MPRPPVSERTRSKAPRPPADTSRLASRLRRSAGAMPASPPVSKDTPRAKSRTRPSTTTGPIDANDTGTRPRTGPTAAADRVTPRAPPARERTAVSLRSCTARRPREAPRDTRTASSFWRDTPRAITRLPTFTHAMSSTNPAAPRRIQSGFAVDATTASCNGRTDTVQPSFDDGYASARRWPIPSISARATASDVPSRSRPTTRRLLRPRASSASSVKAKGIHTADVKGGALKPSRSTPTTVRDSPSRSMVRPRISGSPP